jgi:hypothetical protein
MVDGLELHSKAVPPKCLDPADYKRGAEDCRPEHDAKGHQRLIPAGREAGELALHEFQLVHDLREIIAGLGGLPKGETLGIEVVIGHASITNPGVVNGPYTASAAKLSAHTAETG